QGLREGFLRARGLFDSSFVPASSCDLAVLGVSDDFVLADRRFLNRIEARLRVVMQHLAPIFHGNLGGCAVQMREKRRFDREEIADLGVAVGAHLACNRAYHPIGKKYAEKGAEKRAADQMAQYFR